MAYACQPVGRVLVHSPSRQYVCTSCRQHITSTGVRAQKRRFGSSSETTTTEKIRIELSNARRLSGPSNATGSPSLLQKTLRHQSNSASPSYSSPTKPKFQRSFNKSDYEFVNVDESISDTEGYVPATSWDGLKIVGTDGYWRHVPAGQQDDFSTWLPGKKRATDREQLVCVLHQAVVSCLACRQAGVDFAQTSHPKPINLQRAALESARVTLSEAGTIAEVQFEAVEQLQDFISTLERLAKTESDGTNAPMFYSVRNQSFLESRLDIDDPITFSILKRFSSLSGHRIPDPIINALLTSRRPLSYLIDQLYKTVVAPEPTKLGQALTRRQNTLRLGNVMISERRETPVDKEKELGRWKLIEKELRVRGLPVLGKLKLPNV